MVRAPTLRVYTHTSHVALRDGAASHHRPVCLLQAVGQAGRQSRCHLDDDSRTLQGAVGQLARSQALRLAKCSALPVTSQHILASPAEPAPSLGSIPHPRGPLRALSTHAMPSQCASLTGARCADRSHQLQPDRVRAVLCPGSSSARLSISPFRRLSQDMRGFACSCHFVAPVCANSCCSAHVCCARCCRPDPRMTMVAHVGPIFSCRVDGDMLYDDSGGQETKSSGLKSLFVSAMVPVHLRVTNKLISIHLH